MYAYEKDMLQGQYRQAVQLWLKEKSNLEYYRNSGLPNAKMLLDQSLAAYENGEISYSAYLVNLQQALGIRQKYLQALNTYDQRVLFLEFLTGKN
jgi:cobalt-zinc-cadmium resistance protein CzcA